MIDYQGKGWYLRKTGKNPRFGYMLHFIQNTLEFAAFTRSLHENDRVTFMTWRGLVELVGCVIPATCQPDDPADMGITFRHKDKIISVAVTVGNIY